MAAIRFGDPRRLLYLVPLALLVTAPVWQPEAARFLRPRGRIDQADMDRAAGQSRRFDMHRIHITLSSGGRKTWRVDAAKARTGKTDHHIAMEDVHAVYLGLRADDDRVVITSKEGGYNIHTRHLSLMRDVVIHKPAKRQTLYTELIHYDDQTKMVYSPTAVRIVGPGFTIDAGRLDYDLTSDAYDLSGRVHCVLTSAANHTQGAATP